MKQVKTILAAACLAAGCALGGDAAFASNPLVKTPETKALLKNLKKQSAKGYMFGHHDDTVYGIGWEGDEGRSDVKSVCGDYPGIISFDLGHIELGDAQNLDKVSFDKIRQEVRNQYKRGGVISLSWHLNNPLTGGDSWDVKDSTVVASVLKGGANYEKFQTWLDRVSAFLNSLKSEDGTLIPVLFRPWHEHTGSWFWWGQALCTTEQYKALWQLTVDALHRNGVKNVLLAYSPGADAADYMERYPGDDLIDLLGFDVYQYGGEQGAGNFIALIQKNLAFLSSYCKKHKKAYAVTEAGYEGIPNAGWWTNVLDKAVGNYHPAYVLVWRNAREKVTHFYAPYPGQVSADNFKQFYNLPQTLFINNLRNLYK